MALLFHFTTDLALDPSVGLEEWRNISASAVTLEPDDDGWDLPILVDVQVQTSCIEAR